MSSLSATLQSLLRLGFTKQPPEYGMPCVSFDLPNLPLKCCDGTSRYYRDVVLVSGLYNDGRTLADIASEISQGLETQESAAAWLVYALRRYLGELKDAPDWVSLGRANQLLVPAVAEQRAYKTRPVCFIDADFARILRKRVSALISELRDTETLSIRFDGSLLRCAVGQDSVEVPASGTGWTGHIVLPDAQGFEFPKRITADGAALDFWQGNLRIGNRIYETNWVEGD